MNDNLKSKSMLKIMSGVSLTAIMTVTSLPAVAQVDEIIVTARRKAENLQSTPVTVSAYNERALETRGITNTSELANFTPNVTFDTTSTFSGAASTFQGFIRGIGQSDFAINVDPGVGVYIDDVYIARTVGSVFELYDIEQVEVLKGPQGTLFGRNAIGGAVNIKTRAPDGDFSAKGSIAYGRFDYIGLDAAINTPIAENLYGSVAVSSRQQDGFQERIIPDIPNIANIVSADVLAEVARNGGDQGRLDNQSIRAKLRWVPNDAFETTFSGDYSRARDSAPAQSVIALVGSQEALANGVTPDGFGANSLIPVFNGCLAGLAPQPLCDAALDVGPSIFNLNGDADPTNDVPFFGGDAIFTGDIDESFATGSNVSNFDSYGISNVTTFDLTDNIELKSIIAYRELIADIGTDVDGSPIALNSANFAIDQNQFSAELQANGSLIDDRLNYTLGAFYFDEGATQADQVPLGGFIQIGGINEQDTRAFALFGEANYDISSNLSVLFGIRYTDERKELQLDQQNLTGFFGVAFAAPFPSGALEDDDGDSVFPRLNADGTPNVNFLGPEELQVANFDDVSIRVGVNYQVTEDLFSYFTFSQGFKSGGFTTRLTAPFNPDFNPSAALIGGGIPPGLDSIVFQPETSDNFEFGIKADLFNGLARVNAAAFWNLYDNIQTVVTRGITPANENAGDGRIRGLELEVEAYPTERLSLVGSFGYTDAEYTDLDPLAAPITEDADFQNTPEFNFALAGNYTQPFHEGDLTFNVNYSWRSEVANDAQNTPELIQDSVGLLGAHIKYEPSDSNWAISAIGRNITNERFIGGGFNAGAGVSIVTATFNRPAEWRVKLDYNF